MEYCTNCGAEIKARKKFCTNCGTKIPSEEANAPAWESFREDYLTTISDRIRSDGQELIHGSIEIPIGGSQRLAAVAFFKAPKKWMSVQTYFLIKMTNSNQVSREIIESFFRHAAQGSDQLPQNWHVPPQYRFLEEGRLYPKGFMGTTGVAKVALLASGDVRPEAMEWVAGGRFEQARGLNNYAGAAIIDLRSNELYLNKAPALLGAFYLHDALRKYLAPL